MTRRPNRRGWRCSACSTSPRRPATEPLSMLDVLKQYHEGPAGESAAYWEEHWDGFDVDDAVAQYARDPLKRVFETNVASGDLLLEAGCGLGQYVVQQRRLGVHAVGLDFAIETLLRVRRHEPTLPLVVGDVNAL